MISQSMLLDSTLRDGSYAINFRFSRQDTFTICQTLDRLGFPYIEVGHGIGLGASEAGRGTAAATDEQYMEAAAEAVQQGRWGMFCIPGIAKIEHIEMAAAHGMDFIRIGTNAEDYEHSKPFIELAKRRGMFVCSNFMKSYGCSPKEFAVYAGHAVDFGADLVYIVDSAGGMFPEEILQYAETLREHDPKIKIGFHGHNNLGMATVNALRACQHSFDLIDVSLEGIGRSSGNTPTGEFLGALHRLGIKHGLNILDVLDAGEKLIRPWLPRRNTTSLDTICGMCQFHTSYLPLIQKTCLKFHVDPRRLIMEVSHISKTEAPEELVESLAGQLAQAGKHGDWKTIYNTYHGNEQESVIHDIGQRDSTDYSCAKSGETASVL